MVNRNSCVGLTIFSLLLAEHFSQAADVTKEYFDKRDKLLNKFLSSPIGSDLVLSAEEEKANRILRAVKSQEFDEGFADPRKFYAAQHFFFVKPQIENSTVFKILKILPKGSSLHSHSSAIVSGDYVYNNITYRENLYAKQNSDGKIQLKFFGEAPGNLWQPIADLRRNSKTFEDDLRHQLTLITDDIQIYYSDPNAAWNIFEDVFRTLSLLKYLPVFKDYFYQGLTELLEDNVKYLEFRGVLGNLYDLDGTTYDPEEVVGIYYDVTQQFLKNHPEFWGVKFIFAPHRFTDNAGVEKYVELFKTLHQKYPGFVAGFDLVGHEDAGPPLVSFIPALLHLQNITNFFFHAGESLWGGMPSDKNLIDAVLLNTSRIGHALAILKHPEVLEVLKANNIAIEIAPISNQILFIPDLRVHPATHLIANNYSIVITPDDPGIFGSKGLSYDWYYAFMALASKDADLKFLKQLALNSIVHSAMEDDLKQQSLKKWQIDWDKFVQNVIAGKY